MGNSEVGHLNLGAGRVVMQDLVRIGESIRDRIVLREPGVRRRLRRGEEERRHGAPDGTDRQRRRARDRQAPVRADRPLRRARGAAHRDPRAARRPRHDAALGARLHAAAASTTRRDARWSRSLGGRYFGMDRDKRWERTEKWYRVAVDGVGPEGTDPLAVIEAAYERNETDEFITPDGDRRGTASRSRRCATATR